MSIPTSRSIIQDSPGHLTVLEPSWPRVDRTRALIAAARLEAHTSVHHRSAAHRVGHTGKSARRSAPEISG